MIVLDTNVVSELMRAIPDPTVSQWVQDVTDDVCVTSVTLGEVFYGLERLPAGDRRDRLRERAEDFFSAHLNNVLVYDARAARYFGVVVAARERAGRPIGTADAQIASICRVHKAAVATRNVKDFDGTTISVLNPWA